MILLFKGKALTYGRRTYKYEEARASGAVGAGPPDADGELSVGSGAELVPEKSYLKLEGPAEGGFVGAWRCSVAPDFGLGMNMEKCSKMRR
jgi:hypothetical protein